MAQLWRSKYLRILTLVLLAQALLFYSASHGDSRPLKQPLKQFPEKLSGWQAINDNVVDDGTLNVLKADDVLSRNYVRTPVPDLSAMTPEVKMALLNSADELFLEYFSTQQQGQAPHSPKNCLPGAGWSPSESGQIAIPVSGVPDPIKVNRYIVSRGQSQAVVLYWYQSHGRVVADEYSAKYYLVLDSMRYHRSDTALIKVVAPVFGNNVDGALKNATDLAQAAFPVALSYFPM